MMTETLKTAALALQLNDAQMAQQADLIVRLMSMAQVGVPTPDAGSPVTRPVLALQALLTAFAAIGAARTECTELAARVAFDMSHTLTVLHEERVAREARTATDHNTATVRAAYPSIH